MKHTWILPLLLCAACGGGKITSFEDALNAQLDVINDMTSVVKTVKDKKSAEAAKPKLEALEKRMNDIQQQASKLEGAPSFDAKHQQKMSDAMTRLMQAMSDVPNDPEVQRALGNPMGDMGNLGGGGMGGMGR